MNSPQQHLIDAIAAGRMLVAPGVYDGLSASLVRNAGFDAAYMSGAAVAASLGIPDLGLASQVEFADRAHLIARTLGEIPLIADADTGFGDVIHVVRTVQLYESAGVSAIQLEDQSFPKKCGHLDGKSLISDDEFCLKIEAAASARRGQMQIIARTDAVAGEGFERALERAGKYVDAGADIIFVEAPETVEQIHSVPAVISAPTLFNLVANGKSPAFSIDEARAAGYSITIVPGISFGTAAEGIASALEGLKTSGKISGHQSSPSDLFKIVGLEWWQEVEATHALAVQRP